MLCYKCNDCGDVMTSKDAVIEIDAKHPASEVVTVHFCILCATDMFGDILHSGLQSLLSWSKPSRIKGMD